MRLENGRFVPYPDFLLSNPIWTHDRVTLSTQLLPGTDRNVDLGNMRRPGNHRAQFRFQLSVEPVSPYNVVDAGTFEFAIVVGAANCDPVRTRFRLTFDGEWSSDLRVMFEGHVSIREV
jgi:hypothetical protein